ncbi:MAG: chemotaxis protein CheW [Firmicutes bacterium]|nr:chemotaxis protein CheW [Bacillota bacterium]
MGQQFVTFGLSEKTYAIPIEDVRAIERVSTIRPVPGAYAAIVGVMNLRGSLLTVADLHIVFNLAPQPLTEKTRLLVIDSVGFLIDETFSVVETETDEEASSQTVGMTAVGRDICFVQAEPLLTALRP